MKIGVLQTGHAPEELAPEYGEYPAHFARLLAGQGFTFDSYAVVDGVFPAGPNAADGWLITGSRHGAYEAHDWIAPLEAFIRAARDADVPLVGVCFGHQIIAQALGGTVKKFDAGWAIGRQTYDWDGTQVSLNAWHQDQVVEVPPGARRHATSAFCENAALVYGRQAFTVQAHPEFGHDFIRDLAQVRGRGTLPDAQVDAAIADDAPIDQSRLATEIAHFFYHRTPA